MSDIRPFGPVIERPSSEAFICENPIDIIKSGRYNKVPFMVGYTNREGMLSEVMQKQPPFYPLNNFELAVPWFLKLEKGSPISKSIARQIKEFYFGDTDPTSEHSKDSFYKVVC